MKNYFLPFIFTVFSLTMPSCGSKEDPAGPLPEEPAYIEGIHAIVPPSASFASDDGAKTLTGSPARNVALLLANVGPGIVKGMGQMNLTKDQYKEIKTFTDGLVEGLETPMISIRLFSNGLRRTSAM